MGFFDRIRKGKLFFGKKEPVVVVAFFFKGKKYILEEFDLEFKQDINGKNQPDSSVYGGVITITISDPPDSSINEWMMNTYDKQNGEFRFLLNTPKIVEGAAFHIHFKDAYCINYQKTASPAGYGLLTTLTISPRLIQIGNDEFENDWGNVN